MTPAATTSPATVATDRKRYATLQAALAMKGHAVYQLQCGAMLVVWRGLSRELRTLDDLETHARRVGAAT